MNFLAVAIAYSAVQVEQPKKKKRKLQPKWIEIKTGYFLFIIAYEFEAIVAGFMVRLIITISSQPVLDLQFIIIIVIIILTALDPGTFFS